jgi:rubrerythrin
MGESKKPRIKALEEMIQIVLLAIPREISAREFYLSAVAKADTAAARDMFLSLAEQEKGHETWLRKVLGDLKVELQALRQG